MAWDYHQLKSMLAEESLPVMVVDLDVFDANTRRISDIAKTAGKRLRLATKSVRVPALIQRIMEVGGDHFQGLMCFSVREAAALAAMGFDDLLIAYPTVQATDLEALWTLRQGESPCQVTLMIDSVHHVERLQSWWTQRAASNGIDQPAPLLACVDMDMSFRPLGLHLGVQRSPIRSLDDLTAVCDAIAGASFIQLDGLMGYEAQIAGLGDASPFSAWMNPIKKWLKKHSREDVAATRQAAAKLLKERDQSPRFFNGGGTGSLRTTTQEPWLTEVTAGSGFLQSHLFDYYADNANAPAFCFGLQVTRLPQPGLVTCHSGGFIASGEIGPDKAPIPFLPGGIQTTTREGCGEVQTPLELPAGLQLGPGDPVFFRPAKAGEIAEHFREYLLVQRGQIIDRVPTYRGLGHCFH